MKPRRSQNSTVTSASRGASTSSASCDAGRASSTTGEKNWLRLACRAGQHVRFAQGRQRRGGQLGELHFVARATRHRARCERRQIAGEAAGDIQGPAGAGLARHRRAERPIDPFADRELARPSRAGSGRPDIGHAFARLDRLPDQPLAGAELAAGEDAAIPVQD